MTQFKAAKGSIHPAWFAAAITFLTLVTTAGYRSAPSVLIVPLEDCLWVGADLKSRLRFQ